MGEPRGLVESFRAGQDRRADRHATIAPVVGIDPADRSTPGPSVIVAGGLLVAIAAAVLTVTVSLTDLDRRAHVQHDPDSRLAATSSPVVPSPPAPADTQPRGG